ncbi:DUF4259 domain-containing protein [Listeria costaricensis]|uniref:DUF4259 domain-containing protein n=1 Tax=Listeria costaricensis TaxID=2026604 RepID=UPI000C088CF4|nr:DUF4259 domain-containing protein [Listeria costaricensis]
MGAWGYEPWNNDTAADWFGGFMEKVDTAYLLAEIKSLDMGDVDYDGDRARALAHVMGALGRTYIWPSMEADELDEARAYLITYLEKMIEPGSEFMDAWGDNEKVKTSVEEQIATLKNLK